MNVLVYKISYKRSSSLFIWGYKNEEHSVFTNTITRQTLKSYRSRIWVFWDMTLCLSVSGADVSKAPPFFETSGISN